MKISHETPLCLLEQSREFNDYSYCLPHLMDECEEYKNFFLKEKELGREIYMDNSLHELGKAYDSKRLMHWLNILKPSNFFVPDVWEEADASIVNAKTWSKIEVPKETTKVTVVQGKSLRDAIVCVQTYKDLGYKKIAFSYGASYYNELYPHPNKDMGKAFGRLFVISKLYEMKLLTDFDRVHLLGTSWPAEFRHYSCFPFIESLDTSNPIMAAMEGKEYNNFGIDSKPQTNLNSCFYKDDFSHNDLIFLKTKAMYNVYKFKDINNI